jgi:hypothetical protein
MSFKVTVENEISNDTMGDLIVTAVNEISNDTMGDLIVTAVEGGINYWVKQAYTTKKPDGMPDCEYFNVPVHEGGVYVIEEIVDEETGEVEKHELTKEKLLKGLDIMGKKYPFHLKSVVSQDFDAETADVLIQCSILGDIVYG